MILIKNINEHSLYYAEEDDHDLVYSVLAPVVVLLSMSVNKRMRAKAILEAYIRKGINECCIAVLTEDGVPIGACIFGEDRRHNVLFRLNVLDKYRVGTGTGVLLHYVLNCVFKGEDVYFYDENSMFMSVSEEVAPGVYKIDSTIGESMNKLFGDICHG